MRQSSAYKIASLPIDTTWNVLHVYHFIVQRVVVYAQNTAILCNIIMPWQL